MGLTTITKHLNERNIRTRDGGRWGIAAVHQILTRTTYIGEHRFNTYDSKAKRPKPESEHVVMEVPSIVTKDEWQAVQAHLKSRNPKWTPPRTVSGPTLLTGIAFCASCGGAMTLRTGKGGRYRYYTCSTRARQGSNGCGGLTVPMDKLDTAVTAHIEKRLLDPRRLTTLLSEVLNRRDDYIARRRTHITELRQRASEADAKLIRLYEAIENGIADLNDPALKGRVAELSDIRDQARSDAKRAASAIERVGPELTEEKVRAFATIARKRLRKSDGTYRRDHLRTVA
ncbi:MAG: recombinase family protein [Roseicyclus sp.]|nr:recombinase family protein [Roseicyclus sp.]